MSKKRVRTLSELLDQNDERPTKKRKLSHNSSTNVSSIRFVDNFDHEEFQQIFEMIENSALTQSLNITHFINKEIAEYAVGRFENCANNKCMNDISILHEDEANKIGYKWCFRSNTYYCSQCMKDAKPCNTGCHCDCCMTLKYIPECGECDVCKSILFHLFGECQFDCPFDWKCNICDFKTCNNCFGTEFQECAECGNQFCKQCRIDPKEWSDLCICNECYDDTIVECNTCNGKCELLYKSNRFLCTMGVELIKCGHTNCPIFVCFNCDEKVRNGKTIICAEQNCSRHVGARCNKHISDNTFCLDHGYRGAHVQTFDEWLRFRPSN